MNDSSPAYQAILDLARMAASGNELRADTVLYIAKQALSGLDYGRLFYACEFGNDAGDPRGCGCGGCCALAVAWEEEAEYEAMR